MAVEYDTSTSSSSTLTDIVSAKESKICKNHVSRKSCRKSCHYICLGALAEMLQLKIRNKYTRNDNFILIGAKYVEDFYRWTQGFMHGQLFVDDFLRSVIASVALFAVGMKLTNELVAWKMP